MPTDQITQPCALCGKFSCGHADKPQSLSEQIVDSGIVEHDLCHMSAKHSVRDREHLLRLIDQGYRIFLDLNAGVKFLRCPGRPDIIYDL